MDAKVFFFLSLVLLLWSVFEFLGKNCRHYYLLLRFNSQCFSPAVIFSSEKWSYNKVRLKYKGSWSLRGRRVGGEKRSSYNYHLLKRFTGKCTHFLFLQKVNIIIDSCLLETEKTHPIPTAYETLANGKTCYKQAGATISIIKWSRHRAQEVREGR